MWTFDPGSSGSLAAAACFDLLAVPGPALLDATRHRLAKPVRLRYRLVGHDVLLEPVEGEPLLAPLVCTDVTLMVDAIDAEGLAGWHVTVTGHVEVNERGQLVLHPTDASGFRLVPTRAG